MSKIATREAYGKALAKLVTDNKNIIVLDADLSKSTKTNDAKLVAPNQHFNMGIAEGNMMAVAAGMSTCNNIVFASTFAMFAAGRAFEQIRNSICYPKLNVKICATHAGITVGEDGASHQSVEDIALMRAIPNMTVISPCDAVETEKAINAVAKYHGPCYVRLGRLGVDTVTDENTPFELGKGVTLKEGNDLTLVATGYMVQQALIAAKELEEKGYSTRVINIHTIKPLDQTILLKAAEETNLIISCEEHSTIGGLGSAISEVLSEIRPTKVVKIGINDTFGESGKPIELTEKYGLTSQNIVKIALKNLN